MCAAACDTCSAAAPGATGVTGYWASCATDPTTRQTTPAQVRHLNNITTTPVTSAHAAASGDAHGADRRCPADRVRGPGRAGFRQGLRRPPAPPPG